MPQPTLTSRRCRPQVDASGFDLFRDQLTGSTPELWRGNGYRFEPAICWQIANGALTSTDQLVDLTGFQSFTMEVMATPTATENLMAKTVESFDGSLDVDSWNGFSKQHLVFDFSAAETNIAAGTYHVVISGITTAGEPVTFGISKLTVREDGTPRDAADPAPNPGAAISIAQADARYVQLGGDSPARKYGVAEPEGSVETLAIAFAREFAAAPTNVTLTLQAPMGGAGVMAWVDGSPTAAGFTARFGAPIDNSYKLHWTADL